MRHFLQCRRDGDDFVKISKILAKQDIFSLKQYNSTKNILRSEDDVVLEKVVDNTSCGHLAHSNKDHLNFLIICLQTLILLLNNGCLIHV